jgi:4'-phosphopantetheinyl transferase EntD
VPVGHTTDVVTTGSGKGPSEVGSTRPICGVNLGIAFRDLQMSTPFSLAFARPCSFGTLAAVHLPSGVEAVTNDVLDRLDPQERAVAMTLRARRQIEFTGGRLAFRALKPDAAPLIIGERGEPLCPPGFSVSLTHKDDLALAIVGEAAEGTLGLDLEGDARERMTIANRVLRPEEQAVVAQLPDADAEKWRAVLLRFAIKEAAYKAIHPHLQRFVGFQEALVVLGAEGEATLSIVTEPGLVLEACWESLGGPRILALVRAKRR